MRVLFLVYYSEPPISILNLILSIYYSLFKHPHSCSTSFWNSVISTRITQPTRRRRRTIRHPPRPTHALIQPRESNKSWIPKHTEGGSGGAPPSGGVWGGGAPSGQTSAKHLSILILPFQTYQSSLFYPHPSHSLNRLPSPRFLPVFHPIPDTPTNLFCKPKISKSKLPILCPVTSQTLFISDVFCESVSLARYLLFSVAQSAGEN